jgi:hypothetical protein
LDAVTRGEFARRLAASSDLFHHSQRLPSASVNFITAHDGFSLRDVVSYHRKHNLANGEDNRDGRDNELSANFGVEGPTDDAAVNEVRGRVQRAMMATLLLSQGTPMLTAGDEIGKSQRGNNNAYCQDAPLSWIGPTPTPPCWPWCVSAWPCAPRMSACGMTSGLPTMVTKPCFPKCDGWVWMASPCRRLIGRTRRTDPWCACSVRRNRRRC